MGREPRDSRPGTWSHAVAVALLTCAVTAARAADILVIFPTTAQSHYRVVRPLVHGLLDRGHRVLAITNFPDARPRANLSHIDIAGLKPHSALGVDYYSDVFKTMSHVSGIAAAYEPVLGHPPVVDLLRSGRAFDLVIAEYFTTTPMFAPIAAAVNAPIVGFCPMITFPSVHRLTGVPTVPSYMPDVFNGYSAHWSSPVHRFVNAAVTVAIDVLQKWMYAWQIRPINRRHYGAGTTADPLWIAESLANVSVVLTNNYRGAFMTLPRVPSIVEVGGIHVRDAKPLPQDLSDFINNADHGVILFSLGSIVSESSLGTDTLNNIMTIFSRIKQRVIMKFNLKSCKTQPPNVKIVKWFPQRDLLAHPKVLLFISHAGIMSVIETVHCGKPMIAIPIFGDQLYNANLLVEKQVAIALKYKNLINDELFNAINKILTGNYKYNAIQLQQVYNDRPQSPLETAIFWTEYVIRHKNESKELLKSPNIHLSLYQTYLIDVLVALILPIIVAIWIISWLLDQLRKN